MKNATESQLKKCIFKTLKEFEYDLRQLPVKLRVETSYDGLDCYPLQENADEDGTEIEITKLLSDYYGVKVTSVHMDQWDDVGIWICYKDQ